LGSKFLSGGGKSAWVGVSKGRQEAENGRSDLYAKKRPQRGTKKKTEPT